MNEKYMWIRHKNKRKQTLCGFTVCISSSGSRNFPVPKSIKIVCGLVKMEDKRIREVKKKNVNLKQEKTKDIHNRIDVSDVESSLKRKAMLSIGRMCNMCVCDQLSLSWC